MWNEDNFDINSTPYTKEAYEAKKYAFVSDYVRLWALEREGGLYLDVDMEVRQPFNPLIIHKAFAGFEGSKHLPVMMAVCASEPHGLWVKEMLDAYLDRHFILEDGKYDLTTNVQFITAIMTAGGFRQDGTEQNYRDLHIFPVDYFSPRQTTGEYIQTSNTFCEHKGLNSWGGVQSPWKRFVVDLVGPRFTPGLIKFKRRLFG